MLLDFNNMKQLRTLKVHDNPFIRSDSIKNIMDSLKYLEIETAHGVILLKDGITNISDIVYEEIHMENLDDDDYDNDDEMD